MDEVEKPSKACLFSFFLASVQHSFLSYDLSDKVGQRMSLWPGPDWKINFYDLEEENFQFLWPALRKVLMSQEP
jgi:hypothetical protein